MIFTSQRVNLDKTPWVGPTGERYATQEQIKGRSHYDPRPEFEPTRDPFPYVSALGARYAYPGTLGSERLVWSPRREQFDTPVNRVLVAFRANHQGKAAMPDHAALWVEGMTLRPEALRNATPDEIEHARKVLTRLAAL